jgi:REP element-mobilizing transposase RayT
MPRYARLVRPGAIFHITARGNYRQQVFFDSEDYETYLSLLGKHAASFQVRLLGWYLMINHVHLLVYANDTLGMAQTMKRTQGPIFSVSQPKASSSKRPPVAEPLLLLARPTRPRVDSPSLHRMQPSASSARR